MDRMKDSGSFDAGSTPAGCTYINLEANVTLVGTTAFKADVMQ